MADIVLDKNAPDYKEKLTEKRRILMAKTRQIKKDNSLVKKENHKKTVEEEEIIIVKKPKKKEPKQKIIYVEREPPTVKRQIVKPLQELQEQQVEKPAKIDYSKYFNLK